MSSGMVRTCDDPSSHSTGFKQASIDAIGWGCKLRALHEQCEF